MINSFWTWMYQTVNSALSTLNTMYNNSVMRPFFDILIVIIGTIVIMRFIIKPLIGSGSGSSDRARKSSGREDNEE